MFRDATLTLAKDFDFARRLVNSGRLSVPTVQYGMPAADAPITIDGRDDWLLRQMQPGRFTLMVFDDPTAVAQDEDLLVLRIDGATDAQGLVRRRYEALPGAAVLLRPDQHVCARWRKMPTGEAIRAAMRRALGQDVSHEELAACL